MSERHHIHVISRGLPPDHYAPGRRARSGELARHPRFRLTKTAEEIQNFVRDIKRLFRAKDRDFMSSHFDLFDYGDVVENADAIVGALRSGQMPCDGAWPESQVDKLQQWIDLGRVAEPVGPAGITTIA